MKIRPDWFDDFLKEKNGILEWISPKQAIYELFIKSRSTRQYKHGRRSVQGTNIRTQIKLEKVIVTFIQDNN